MKNTVLELIEKHLDKDIYLHKKGSKLLMSYNSITMECQKMINSLDIHQSNHPDLGQNIDLK